MINRRFGRLIVIKDRSSKRYGRQWFHLCRCDCGTVKEFSGCHLVTGATQSCGCKQAEELSNRVKTHGYTGTRTYSIWKGIKSRCYNKSKKAYPRYGGSGILMQKSWKSSFERFLKDMGECPDGLTIDRINGKKGYTKRNCRWATYQEQARNTKPRGPLPKGIRKLPSGRYAAQICTNYKNKYIGSFNTLREAKQARLEAEDKYWK